MSPTIAAIASRLLIKNNGKTQKLARKAFIKAQVSKSRKTRAKAEANT